MYCTVLRTVHTVEQGKKGKNGKEWGSIYRFLLSFFTWNWQFVLYTTLVHKSMIFRRVYVGGYYMINK